MSPVDRNILRVATLELLERDVPPNAAIDEAVEITKRFSGEEAARFVNGVLNAVKQTDYAEGGVSGSDRAGRTRAHDEILNVARRLQSADAADYKFTAAFVDGLSAEYG